MLMPKDPSSPPKLCVSWMHRVDWKKSQLGEFGTSRTSYRMNPSTEDAICARDRIGKLSSSSSNSRAVTVLSVSSERGIVLN